MKYFHLVFRIKVDVTGMPLIQEIFPRYHSYSTKYWLNTVRQ